MTSTEIRDALTEVRDAVEVPPVDEVAFRARVRAERRRHVGGRALLAGAAAAVLAVGAVGATRLVDAGGGRDVPVASGVTPRSGSVSETVWFVRDGHLTALDPAGKVHELSQRSEGVIGWTSERVYALDGDSHVVVLGRETDHEGLGGDTAYPREKSPVADAVQSVALSADGRYLAWMDLQHTVTVFDVKADRVQFRVDVPRTSYVSAVSAEGVLVSEDVDLVLHTPSGETQVPTQEAGDSWGAQLAMGRVLVAGPAGSTSVYDLSSGTAERIAVLPGVSPTLASYAAAAATIEPTADDASAVVHVWDGERVHELRGLDGVPQEVRFEEAGGEVDGLLVVTHGGAHGLWSCSATELTCVALPVPGEVSLAE
ncbi:hypothetical protein ACT8ZV_21375 [Nocardioides sp. MAHUQ-72]|uniref:hypothetical protein n=1 Tax=unclassified Nocardioides TaxID=2615069 RepID=UPI0036173198